jgi:hypothetical protein
MSAYKFKINLDDSCREILIDQESNLDKLFKLVNIYLDISQEINYRLLYKKTNIKSFDTNTKLKNIFENDLQDKNDLENEMIYELYVEILTNKPIKLNFDMEYDKIKFSISLDLNSTLQILKFNILALCTNLKEENFCILFKHNDITNIHSNATKLSDIFLENEEEKICLNIVDKEKNIVEFSKICCNCGIKATNICIKCAKCNCKKCEALDLHYNPKILCSVEISNFKGYETNFINNLILELNDVEKEMKINTYGLQKDKLKKIEKSIDDLISQLVYLKENVLKKFENHYLKINEECIPDELSKNLTFYRDEFYKYLKQPYFDCEESMKKLLDFNHLKNSLLFKFKNFRNETNKLEKNLTEFSNIQQSLEENIRFKINHISSLLKKQNKDSINHYFPMMKIYNNKSLIVYDHMKNQFSVMNFIDLDGKFRENFNNFVQINFSSKDRLFIITGNPCQKLFCYNLNTNEMEFVNTLKHNHNWWPSLILLDEPNENNLTLFCLSGTYTNKAEKLVINLNGNFIFKNLVLEWSQLPSLNVNHGQASSIVQNNRFIFVFFGYDNKFDSIPQVEKLDLNNNSDWELINFKNPDSISSFIYYNSILYNGENDLYILGGRKEINEVDSVYKYDLINNVLTKSEYFLELNHVDFLNEKIFFCIESKTKKEKLNQILKSEKNNIFALFDSNNRIHIINSENFHHTNVSHI